MLPSARAVPCTGSPQGCVLSPLLYILYTHDCHSKQTTCSYLVKFADDSALLYLLKSGHGAALNDFAMV